MNLRGLLAALALLERFPPSDADPDLRGVAALVADAVSGGKASKSKTSKGSKRSSKGSKKSEDDGRSGEEPGKGGESTEDGPDDTDEPAGGERPNNRRRGRGFHDWERHDPDKEDKIINGEPATAGRYPYAVSIEDDFGHFCGGSLVARDVVLTAAHCAGAPYDVVLGRQNLKNKSKGETIRMKRELPHPDYDRKTTDNDFMLVFLSKPAKLESAKLLKINVDPASPSVGEVMTVVGWGDTDIRDDVSRMSDVLMKVNVKVIPNGVCERSEGTIGGERDDYHGQITDNMMCAKAFRQDSCQGDSGGPAVISGNRAGEDVQVGVVSWGIGCASDDFPGVYARLSRVNGWIKKEVCRGSQYAREAGFDCDGNGGGGGASGTGFRPSGGAQSRPDGPTRRPTRKPSRRPKPGKQPGTGNASAPDKPTRRPRRRPSKKPSKVPRPKPPPPAKPSDDYDYDFCPWCGEEEEGAAASG